MNKIKNNGDDQVKQRAFEPWQQNGSQEGYQAEFWALAERELEVQRNTIEITANPVSAKTARVRMVQVSRHTSI